jgi:hypothetical protein
MHRVAHVLLAGMIASGAAAATSLAVIRTDKEIVIAADSRVTSLSSAESQPDMCKVRQTGNAIAAFVGLVSASTGTGASLDATGTVDAILDENGTLAAKAEQIRSTLGQQLERVLSFASRAVFRQLNGFVLGVVIAGEDEDEPVMKLHYVEFTLSRAGALISGVSHCPGDGCPHGVVRIVAPPTPDIDFRDTGEHWARGYVQSQIDRGLPTIGPPLQLVRITHRGLDWIDQPLVCSK